MVTSYISSLVIVPVTSSLFEHVTVTVTSSKNNVTFTALSGIYPGATLIFIIYK